MFLGTGSDVGKSVTATAFCRILKQNGLRVAPFKAQNMSNNSFVTVEGGEIGRAQAAQAEACGLPPSVHMNPVLLKPNSDLGSQVVMQGAVLGNFSAAGYYALKPKLKEAVQESFRLLEEQYDAIIMEGAGSCAEINLRDHDIVNFEMALMTRSPVVLVADIDRGGVFAQIIGTLNVIAPRERDLVAGFLINKFRGDPCLFQSGIDYIEQSTGKPVFGLVPVYTGFSIDTEDSMSLDAAAAVKPPRPDKINIAVVRLPHVSNFTDLAALAREGSVLLNWLEQPVALEPYDLLVIPGSKNTLNDMAWLEKTGWCAAIREFAAPGRNMVIGLCGGFQMLGREILDPHAVESNRPRVNGIGLLDVFTRMEKTKIVRLSTGTDRLFSTRVRGYEIHMGQTERGGAAEAFLDLDSGAEGASNREGNVFGTYLHGLFDSAGFRARLLESLASRKGLAVTPNLRREDFWLEKERHYDLLAEHFRQFVDTGAILRIMRNSSR